MFVKNVCDYPYAFIHNGQKIIIPNDNRIYIIPNDVDVNLIRGFLSYKTEHKHIDVDANVLKVSIDIDDIKTEPEIINTVVEEPQIEVVKPDDMVPEIVVEKKIEKQTPKPVVASKEKPKSKIVKKKKVATKQVAESSEKK